MPTTEEATTLLPTESTRMPFQHALKFFVEDTDLSNTLSQYIRQAVEGGQGALVIATPARWRGLANSLDANRLTGDVTLTENAQLERLVERGQLVFVNAQEARQEMMVKGEPSRVRFETHFEALIDQMNDTWPGVHVYDETGDLLARDSQFGPMRQLERMWSDYRRVTPFGLLSAYCLESFGETADEQPFDNLCESRAEVLAAGDSSGAAVARSQRRTVALYRRFDEQQDELEQTREQLAHERKLHQLRSEYIGKFAHELRNPMAPVLCAVEMMNLRGDASNQRERGIIERQVSRLADMIDDFLDVTHVMFDRSEIQKSQVEIDDVLRLARQMAQSLIDERGHRLHVDGESAGILVEADPDCLAQGLAKMLENSAIYTPEGGNIWFETQREAGSVAISVRDDGPGIDAALLDDVFGMFVQGDVDDSIEGRGMGTGLAIARQVAELHGGAVAAYNNKEGDASGSEVVMRLPLARPKERVSNVSRLKKGEISSGRRVLVVDDDHDFASMLSETLDLLGHDVRVAYDAADALDALGDFWPDVALLDIKMPGMTGHELAERIEQHSSADDTRGACRLVALTGYGDERKRRRSEEMGFNAHLVKPIVLSQLQETLDQVLDD